MADKSKSIKSSGFSMLEVLISLVFLALGSTAYFTFHFNLNSLDTKQKALTRVNEELDELQNRFRAEYNSRNPSAAFGGFQVVATSPAHVIITALTESGGTVTSTYQVSCQNITTNAFLQRYKHYEIAFCNGNYTCAINTRPVITYTKVMGSSTLTKVYPVGLKLNGKGVGFNEATMINAFFCVDDDLSADTVEVVFGGAYGILNQNDKALLTTSGGVAPTIYRVLRRKIVMSTQLDNSDTIQVILPSSAP